MFDRESRTKDLEIAYGEIGVSHFDGNPETENNKYTSDLRAVGRQGTLFVIREILRERMEIEKEEVENV